MNTTATIIIANVHLPTKHIFLFYQRISSMSIYSEVAPSMCDANCQREYNIYCSWLFCMEDMQRCIIEHKVRISFVYVALRVVWDAV